MLANLVPHPESASNAVTGISVTLKLEQSKLSICYVVSGDLDRIAWPSAAPAVRTDVLWKHTCFEAFIGRSQAGYTEYNFSPSGAWASYFFDQYRDGMRPATWLANPVVQVAHQGVFSLTTQIDLTPHWRDGASHLALSAVIEEIDGTKSYWALAHAPGPPDFHNADCFIARLPAPEGA